MPRSSSSIFRPWRSPPFSGVGLALPALISLLGAPIEGTFILLVIALICFWILLLDFHAEPERLEQG